MKILSIETSCDETAISIIDAKGGTKHPTFTVLGNALFSQAQMHAKYGGVYPNLAKREHSKNIAPLLKLALKEAKMLKKRARLSSTTKDQPYLEKLLEREQDFLTALLPLVAKYKKPPIDIISVTSGPGLEPALWVGINVAKALAHVWNIPVLPINHMEGHTLSSLLFGSNKKLSLPTIQFPALALLISGGHTELVLMKNWLSYKVVGQTRDDAVGEAFDKVARMIKLPYPGGPEISAKAQEVTSTNRFNFPRPMIHSGDLDFSFSGIKTAVLYTVKKLPRLTSKIKAEISFEFQEAVTEVLLKKTINAAKKYKVKTILLGGGVSANKRIQVAFKKTVKTEMSDINLYIPPASLSTDNAIMIGVAAYLRALHYPKDIIKTERKLANLRAHGTKPL